MIWRASASSAFRDRNLRNLRQVRHIAQQLAVAAAPTTNVKIYIEMKDLIQSLKENKGDLVLAISKLAKDTPSSSIKLQPPKEEQVAFE